MKVLQIVPSISLIYGGPSQMVLGLAPALVNAGAEVTVITTNSNGDFGQEPLDVPLNQPILQDGYKIIYFPCALFRRYKFSWDLYKWLNSNVRNFDIVHIHALFSPVSSIAARICRYHQVPYILRPLGTLDPADLRKKKLLKKLYIALLERHNIADAAAIHFTSKQEAKISQRFGVTTQDLVIPLGVVPTISSLTSRELTLSEWNIPQDKPLLVFMSRIEPKKGLDLLIPALDQLFAQGIDFHFILAGSNPQDPIYEAKIRDKIQNSHWRSHTTITGFVRGEVKAHLLQAADLFILPSYYENFGIAVAEAMVAGTPVIISDQVHIYLQVQDSQSGWVVKNDVSEIAESIKQALKNPPELQRRGLNAKNYALQHFSWDAIAQQTIRAYQQNSHH